jgi:hypothetical protein
VSFRSINTVAILGRRTWRVKWFSAGVTLRQHSPRMWGGKGVLVFDNLGGEESRGGTRLAMIDLETRMSRTIFPKSDSQSPPLVHSGTAGHLDINKAGDAVLMAVTHQKIIYEVDLETGEVLWEYVCVDPANRVLRPIYTARYCYDVSFPMNQVETTE